MKKIVLLAALLASRALAQTPEPAPGQTVPAMQGQGEVIVSDQRPPPVPVAAASSSNGSVEPGPADALPSPAVTDAERAAVRITRWTLDLHLRPEDAREEMQAALVLRNASARPLDRVALQVSSSLRWQTVSVGGRPATFTQSPIATDEDHTGYAQEVVIALGKPLAPGASVDLSVLYTGTVAASAARLELLGVDSDRAAATDWDAITGTSDQLATALRGFGHVLWYPVAASAAALGDGNRVTALEAEQRRLGLQASMALHLTVEYAGDPPDGVIFNGVLQPLTRVADDPDQLVGQSRGVATADFAAAPLGFRIPSLFLTAQEPVATDGQLLNLITADADAAAPYTAAAELEAPLLADWLGPTPDRPVLLLNHPGEPFEDHAFLAAQLAADAQPAAIAPNLLPALTSARFAPPGAGNVWLERGMPEFLGLLATERATGQGRAAALARLKQASVLIGLAEPDFATAPDAAGEPLVSAGSDVMLRVKAASVLWQLKEILGEQRMREALIAYRRNLLPHAEAAGDPHAFETSLEHSAGEDLAWFFADWVYRDRGLPDLSIAQVNPRPLPAKGGKSGGYLVAVEVRNDGDAVADVPVTVRSPGLRATERLRIAAHATGSTRIVFEATPETVEVNDGSVPELRTTEHVFHITMEPGTP